MGELSLDAYIRVSRVRGREGPSFQSPDQQREAIKSWAKVHGAKIVAEHEDLDRSGGTTEREAFQAALARIEAGKSDGLVVAKLDRFARSILGAWESIERIRAAGGTFVSVADQFDLSTSTGTLMFNIMASFAQFERERITESWATAQGRAISRGAHFQAPFGYVKGDDGRLVLDPDAAPLVEEVFRRRAAGSSWRDLARFLTDRTDGAPRGAFWTPRAVQHIVKRRTYLGVASHGAHELEDAHEPIVPEALWLKANARRQVNPTSSGEAALLTGVIRCAGCRHAMKSDTARWRDGERRRQYRCRGSSGSGPCPEPASIMAHVIEPVVVGHLFLYAGHAAARETGANGDLERAREAVATAEIRVERWRDDPELQEAMPPDQFRAGLLARLRALEEAEGELDRAKREAANAGAPVILADDFYALNVAGRRDLIRQALAAVFVKRGNGHSDPMDRTLIFWSGDERTPARLPGRGVRGADTSRINWPEGFSTALASVPDWAWRTGHPAIPEWMREEIGEVAQVTGAGSLVPRQGESEPVGDLATSLGRLVAEARQRLGAADS